MRRAGTGDMRGAGRIGRLAKPEESTTKEVTTR